MIERIRFESIKAEGFKFEAVEGPGCLGRGVRCFKCFEAKKKRVEGMRVNMEIIDQIMKQTGVRRRLGRVRRSLALLTDIRGPRGDRLEAVLLPFCSLSGVDAVIRAGRVLHSIKVPFVVESSVQSINGASNNSFVATFRPGLRWPGSGERE